MSKAPDKLLVWARNLDEMLTDIIENESDLKKVIDDEVQEGEKIIENEKEDFELEREVENDLEAIQSDLQAIQEALKTTVGTVKADNKRLNTIQGKLESEVESDIGEIEQRLKDIAEDLATIKEDKADELREVGTQTAEYRTTYQILVEADNNVAKVDEMVNSLIQTANHADDGELNRIANDIENKREEMEERINQLEQEESNVGREFSEEENVLAKEIKLDKEILGELRQEIKEDNQITTEIGELEKAVAEVNGHGLADYLEQFREQMPKIKERLEKISALMQEMENLLEKEYNEVEEAEEATK